MGGLVVVVAEMNRAARLLVAQRLNRVELCRLAGGVMVLTGAGVSTDSGVPDYRGPQGSLSRHTPMTYQEFRQPTNERAQ